MINLWHMAACQQFKVKHENKTCSACPNNILKQKLWHSHSRRHNCTRHFSQLLSKKLRHFKLNKIVINSFLPHTAQMWGLSLPWILWWCLFKLVLVMKFFGHSLHWNGLSPVWFLIWTLRDSLLENAIEHWSQMNVFFFGLCFHSRWFLRCQRLVNAFLHSLHIKVM